MINQVSIKVPNACGVNNWESCSVADFKSMSLKERMQCIQEGAVQFFDDTGAKVPVKEALKQIA